MPTSVRIRNVSKRYHLGRRATNDSIREAIAGWFRRAPKRDEAGEELWAVRDVSLDIQQGEVLGIIGRNGAGKSTLLKLLSRISAPTTGEIEVHGKISGLLEVGTGFHPELTGRENIFLNGSILGMSRAEIRRRFDEIVAFSELERFVDTPVKFYSSGMHIRLGFAVAAHLDADILLLDEVLAVGDLAFQRKCLSKMDDVVNHGRTVVFVSHNMTAIRNLCARTVLIDAGRVVADGATPQTIREFNQRLRTSNIDATTHFKERFENLSAGVRFTHFAIEDGSGQPTYEFREGESFRVHVEYKVFEEVPDLLLFFALTSEVSGDFVTSVRYTLSDRPLSPGYTGKTVIEFPNSPLLSREYYPYIWLGSHDGIAYDRLNYSLTSCPPLIISPRQLGVDQAQGFFVLPSRLVAG